MFKNVFSWLCLLVLAAHSHSASLVVVPVVAHNMSEAADTDAEQIGANQSSVNQASVSQISEQAAQISEQTATPSKQKTKSTLSPGTMLARMGQALNSGNFRMSMVYIHDGRVDPLRFSHLTQGQHRYDKLENLQGGRRMVISQNEDTYLLLERELLHLEKEDGSPMIRWRRQLQLLVQNQKQYNIRISGPSRVAGRTSFQVLFSPLDNQRFGTRIWLDSVSGLPLSVATIASDGAVVEQMLTVELELLANLTKKDFELPDNAFFQDKDLAQIDTEISGNGTSEQLNGGQKVPINQKSDWNVNWTPAGFKLSSMKKVENSSESYEHLVFNDGMTTLSIFIENHQEKKPIRPRSNFRGGTLIYDLSVNNARITIIGSISAVVAEKIARSIEPLIKRSTTLK